MLRTIQPVAVRPFPSRSAGTWSCTACGGPFPIGRSWTVEVQPVHGRTFSIVLCDTCVDGVDLPRGAPDGTRDPDGHGWAA